MQFRARILRAALAAAALVLASGASAQGVKHFRFAYDQPRNTGYSIAGDLFSDKLKDNDVDSLVTYVRGLKAKQ